MTGARVKVGVIGLGRFGESHLHAYRSIRHAEVVAVASRSRERANEIASRFAVPRSYDDFRALIADPGVEAISVTTGEHDHRDPVVAALAAGKPVLVEKPMASTLADADAMLEAARRSAAFLMPGHILRFEPKYAALKEAVERGELGELTSISARRNRLRGQVPIYGRAGPALVTAIHDIDVMLWITGSTVVSVRAFQRLGTLPGDHCGVWALMRLASGTIAMIESSWMTPDGVEPGGDDAFSAIGTKGLARIQFDVPPMWISTSDGLRAPDVSFEPRVNGVSTGALREELAYFTACVLDGIRPTAIAPEDGRAALAVALAMIDSARQDREIVLAPPAVPVAS
ncbi:MAG TPA: Gfo/Idh/MocA family oxidoreductase [Thermomicrobiales bacterium]